MPLMTTSSDVTGDKVFSTPFLVLSIMTRVGNKSETQQRHEEKCLVILPSFLACHSMRTDDDECPFRHPLSLRLFVPLSLSVSGFSVSGFSVSGFSVSSNPRNLSELLPFLYFLFWVPSVSSSLSCPFSVSCVGTESSLSLHSLFSFSMPLLCIVRKWDKERSPPPSSLSQ